MLQHNNTPKLLLISPPYSSLRDTLPTPAAHIGLLNLATYLKKHNIENMVLIADLFANIKSKDCVFLNSYIKKWENYKKYIQETSKHIVWSNIEEIVKSYNPTIIGISSTTPAIHSALKVASIVKRLNKDIIVVLGGPHATVSPDSSLENEDIDFVIRGEGEIPLLHLMKTISTNNHLFNKIPSLSYKDSTQKIIHNPLVDQIQNIDELPFPDIDLMILPKDYSLKDYAIQATRGCVFNCTFCAGKRLWPKFTYRSVENIAEEIIHAINAYPAIRKIYFNDATLVFNKLFITKLCNAIISRQIKSDFYCTARFDTIDQEVLQLMKKAGFKGVYIGAESGDNEILNKMSKRITVKDILEKNQLLKNSGISSLVSVLVGMPGDNPQALKNTISMMKKINPDAFDVNTYIPLPGTKLYDEMPENTKMQIDYLKYSNKCPRPFVFDINKQDDCIRLTRKIIRLADRVMLKTIILVMLKRAFNVFKK